jgi:hypothetical protein
LNSLNVSFIALSDSREEYDKEMWEFKIKEMIVIDWMCFGRIRNNTYETLHSLPHEMKVTIIQEAQNKEKMVKWYEEYPRVIIPKDLSYIPVPNTEDKIRLELQFKEENKK